MTWEVIGETTSERTGRSITVRLSREYDSRESADQVAAMARRSKGYRNITVREVTRSDQVATSSKRR